MEHSGNCATLFTDTVPSLNNFSMSEEELKSVQNQRFSEIYSLSIVGDK